MIEDNATSKWCKEMGLNSYYPSKLNIVYNENENTNLKMANLNLTLIMTIMKNKLILAKMKLSV